MDEKVSQGLIFLHDCELLEINYSSDSEGRRLSMLLQVPHDLDYVPWAAQLLLVKARGIYHFHYVAWGHVAGKETLDAWNEGVSPATQLELDRHAAMGLRVPPLKFTVVFHSGSHLELVCEDVTVDIETAGKR